MILCLHHSSFLVMMHPAVLFALGLLICRGLEPARCEEGYQSDPAAPSSNGTYDPRSSLSPHRQHRARDEYPHRQHRARDEYPHRQHRAREEYPHRQHRARDQYPRAYDFCTRSLASVTCPNAHTTDDFRVERYLGRWYEIGSTALYKFQYERGLICDHTIHSLLVPRRGEFGPVLSILGRGYQTLTPIEAAGISHLSAAAQDVCSNARTICSIVDPHGLLRQAISELSETIAIIRNDSLMRHRQETANLVTALRNLQSLANNIQAGVDKLSRRISRLQALNANISQGTGNTQQNIDALMEESSSTDNYVQSLNLLVSQSSANIRAQITQDANFVRLENGYLALRLEHSFLAVSAELSRVGTYLTGIGIALTGVSASSRALAGLPPSRGAASSLPVTEVRGVVVQDPDARGKLELHQFGAPSQYWVLDVERSNASSRGYVAVLVYSCIEHGLDGVLPRENLFILAKNRTLPLATVNRFLETARRYGIYTECDNTFVHTVQHGICGWPYP